MLQTFVFTHRLIPPLYPRICSPFSKIYRRQKPSLTLLPPLRRRSPPIQTFASHCRHHRRRQSKSEI